MNVTADLPLVNLSNATRKQHINEQIDNLSLINRDVYALLQLTPGVQPIKYKQPGLQ